MQLPAGPELHGGQRSDLLQQQVREIILVPAQGKMGITLPSCFFLPPAIIKGSPVFVPAHDVPPVLFHSASCNCVCVWVCVWVCVCGCVGVGVGVGVVWVWVVCVVWVWVWVCLSPMSFTLCCKVKSLYGGRGLQRH